MKTNLLIVFVISLAAPMAAATWFPVEPAPMGDEEAQCRYLCGERNEESMRGCDYLPSSTPTAQRNQCYQVVHARMEGCIAGCPSSYDFTTGEGENFEAKTPDLSGNGAASSSPDPDGSAGGVGSSPQIPDHHPGDPGCGFPPDAPDGGSYGNGGGSIDPGCGVPDYPGV